MRVANLAGLELKRYLGSRVMRGALVVITLIPLLYGALYLWAFWDPYGRLHTLPVALVDADRPVATAGRSVSAGADLEKRLLESRTFDWKVVDAATAEKGVADGDYYLSLTIPADFSATLASADRPGAAAAALQVHTNDATNYLAGQISRLAFSEIRSAASAKATEGYLDRMLVGFSDVRTSTGQAADGATRLAGGASTARRAATTLADGGSSAATGAQQLHDGAQSAAAGASTLSHGLTTLGTGTRELASGAAQTEAGSERLAAGLGRLATSTQHLPAQAAALEHGSASVAAGDEKLAAGISAYVAAHGGDPAGRSLVAAAQQVSAGAHDVAAGAAALGTGAPALQQGLHDASSAADRLATGTARVSTGATAVATGAGTAAAGAQRLAAGTAGLATGAGELAGGVVRLSDGARALSTGLTSVQTGAGTLADRLAAGTSALPSVDASARAHQAQVMAQPVVLDTRRSHPIDDYGTGFAPYFIPLALWIGALLTYFFIRPVSSRAVASNAPAWVVSLAGYLPGAVIGVGQVAALLVVLHHGLGLHATSPVALWAFMIFSALVFVAILQLLIQALGTAGRLVGLVLLMLQLTSCAGTFPIETAPRFFQVLSPYLPMTYVVSGLRQGIGGDDLGVMARDAAVLAVFGVAALGLTTLSAARARVWTIGRLHPELAI